MNIPTKKPPINTALATRYSIAKLRSLPPPPPKSSIAGGDTASDVDSWEKSSVSSSQAPSVQPPSPSLSAQIEAYHAEASSSYIEASLEELSTAIVSYLLDTDVQQPTPPPIPATELLFVTNKKMA